jgi:hypothetical protein
VTYSMQFTSILSSFHKKMEVHFRVTHFDKSWLLQIKRLNYTGCCSWYAVHNKGRKEKCLIILGALIPSPLHLLSELRPNHWAIRHMSDQVWYRYNLKFQIELHVFVENSSYQGDRKKKLENVENVLSVLKKTYTCMSLVIGVYWIWCYLYSSC